MRLATHAPEARAAGVALGRVRRRVGSSAPQSACDPRRRELCDIGVVGVSVRVLARPCHVLGEDPDLAEAVPPATRERAVRECLARVISMSPGRWQGAESAVPNEGIGLLVLSGLLIRRVAIDARFGAELLGEGDLLRPWQGEGEPSTLPVTTAWRILEPTRMAVLDEAFVRRLLHYPPVLGRLVGRALERSRKPGSGHGDRSSGPGGCARSHAPLAPRRTLGSRAQRRRQRAAADHAQRPSRPRSCPPPNRHQCSVTARQTQAPARCRRRMAADRRAAWRAARAHAAPLEPPCRRAEGRDIAARGSYASVRRPLDPGRSTRARGTTERVGLVSSWSARGPSLYGAADSRHILSRKQRERSA